MYYLYSIHKISDVWDEDEIPYVKREWWILVRTNSDKQALLDWHARFKRDYAYKIVSSERKLKRLFFPRAEVKTRTQTAQMLKALNYVN
jgi:hypothetical protein